MKKAVLISMLLFFMIATACNGQKSTKSEERKSENQPKTNIQVNKEYDEKGNLIRYDSTYSYYYSSAENDIHFRDSVLNQFKQNFNTRFQFFRDPFFEDFFYRDSLMNLDFFSNDFFENRFRDNFKRMNELMMEMDSMKNLFFREKLQESEKKKGIIL